jgi:hypothetical protein
MFSLLGVLIRIWEVSPVDSIGRRNTNSKSNKQEFQGLYSSAKPESQALICGRLPSPLFTVKRFSRALRMIG